MFPSTVLKPKMCFLSSFLMMMRSDGSLKMSLMFFPVSVIFVMLFCFYCQAAELPGTVVIVFAGMGGTCCALAGTAAPDAEFPEWLRLGRIARNGCALFGMPGTAAPWPECADGLCLALPWLGWGGVVYMDRHQ